MTDILDLLDDIKFAKPVTPHLYIVEPVEFGAVPNINIFDVAQPIVDQSEVASTAGRMHSATAVMATYDDVLDLEHFYRELHHRQTADVGVHDEIRDVAVNKNLAGFQS